MSVASYQHATLHWDSLSHENPNDEIELKAALPVRHWPRSFCFAVVELEWIAAAQICALAVQMALSMP
jgi:hypothetical protein